jgi:hypothetical protein
MRTSSILLATFFVWLVGVLWLFPFILGGALFVLLRPIQIGWQHTHVIFNRVVAKSREKLSA